MARTVTPWALLELQAKQDASELQEKSKVMKKEVEAAVQAVAAAAAARDQALLGIGNLVHDSVPVDDDEVLSLTVLSQRNTMGIFLGNQ